VTTYTPTAPINYSPATVASTADRTLIIYAPQGTPPASGWPTVLFFNYGGFASGPHSTSIGPESVSQGYLAYSMLQSGVQWIEARCTSINPQSSGGPVNTGTFDPPQSVTANYNHFEDPASPMPWKDAVHAMLWCKTVGAASYAVDPLKIIISGRSSGFSVAAWAGYGTLWNTPTYDPNGQFLPFASVGGSRPLAIMGIQPQAWWPAYAQSNSVPGTPFPRFDNHLAIAQFQGQAPQPATGFPLDWLQQLSPLYFGWDEVKYPNIRARNAVTPSWIFAPGQIYVGLTEAPDFGFSTNYPQLLDTLVGIHDPWHGYMLKLYWERLSPLYKTHSRLVVSAGGNANTIEDLAVASDRTAYDDAREWALGVFGSQPQIEPAWERIVRRIEAAVWTVKGGPVYWTTVRRVYRGNEYDPARTVYPCVVITPVVDDLDQPGEALTSATRDQCVVDLHLLDKTTARHDLIRERFLRDIHVAIYQNPQFSNGTGNQLATNTQIETVERLYTDEPRLSFAAATVRVRVNFRTVSPDTLEVI